MQAALYETFGGPIRVYDNVPIPAVPRDGVLIAVMATGVCRSDWHGWKGHDSDILHHGLPFCPGHEFSGVVVQLGSELLQQAATTTSTTTRSNADYGDADHSLPMVEPMMIQVGDRVAVPFILSCGHCRYCQEENQPTICSHQLQPGFTQWGSFAEYVAVPRAQRHVRKLPPTVSFVQAAALGCRFTTAYRALIQQGQLQMVDETTTTTSGSGRPPQSVAVLGCGGLGLSCIMLAAAATTPTTTTTASSTMSTTTPKRMIVAVDVSEKALQKAKTLGATHVIHVQPNQSAQEIADKLVRISQYGDGMDVTVEAAGLALTSEAAVLATRPGGRMVQVGLPHTPTPSIPMSRVAGKEITIVGSHGFDATVLPHLLQLVANKTLDPCQLVEAHVTLEEGCRALQAMDHSSPLGMVMITKFHSTTTTTTTTATTTMNGNPRL